MVNTHPSKEHKALKDWEAKVIMHAWKDSTFKQLFLSNPRKALKQMNCPFYDQYQTEVKEQSWSFTLPSSPVETNTFLNASAFTPKEQGFITVFC